MLKFSIFHIQAVILLCHRDYVHVTGSMPGIVALICSFFFCLPILIIAVFGVISQLAPTLHIVSSWLIWRIGIGFLCFLPSFLLSSITPYYLNCLIIFLSLKVCVALMQCNGHDDGEPLNSSSKLFLFLILI